MVRPALEPEGEVVVHGLQADAAQQQEVRSVRGQPHRDALLRPTPVSGKQNISPIYLKYHSISVDFYYSSLCNRQN